MVVGPFLRLFLPRITAWRITTGITAAFCAGVLIQHHFLTWGFSQGPSMYPTITDHWSMSIISRREKQGQGNLKVGDIVHVEHPSFRNERACKRIIGMPGDYVLKDEHMASTPGGVSRRVVMGDEEEVGERREPQMVRVPEGHIWLAGDNSSWSRDSRWYGPVPLALVYGKPLYNGNGPFSMHAVDEGLRKVDAHYVDSNNP